MTSVKFLLMLINFLTMVSGVLLLGLSIFGMTAQARATSLYSSGVPLGVLILSIFLIAISAMGFYGTTHAHSITLQTYLAVVMIIFIAQIVLGSIALARAGQVNEIIYDAWEEAYVRHPDAIQRIEKAFQCCGYSSILDRPVPDDCSKDRAFGYIESCRDKIVPAAKDVLRGIGSFLMIIALIEAVAVFLALLLYWQWPDEYDDVGNSGHHESSRSLLRESHGVTGSGTNPAYQPVARA